MEDTLADVERDASFVSALSSFEDELPNELELYRASFAGDAQALKAVLPKLTHEQLTAKDHHGLTALHVAAMRNSDACLKLLLDAGISTNTKSALGWLPVEEAMAYRSQAAFETLMKRTSDDVTNMVEAKARALRDVFSGMPDCAFQLKWELTSTLLGMIIGKYLPHDTYTVYKKGSHLRVDGSLKGLKSDVTSLMPQWKYGSFSLIVDTNNVKRGVTLLDHIKKTSMVIQDVQDKGEADDDADYDFGDDPMMMGRVKYSRVKFANFKLQPVKGWLTSELKEDIEGMSTTVYEAEGELRSSTVIKQTMQLEPDASFKDYLRHPPVEDIHAEVGLNFASAMNDKNGSASEDKAEEMLRRIQHEQREQARADELQRSSEFLPDELFSRFGDAASEPCEVACTSSTYSREDDAACGASGRRSKRASAGAGAAKPVKGRKVRARIWMARNFPLNQKQLLPLLDVMGTTNKYLRKVSTFMRNYGDMELFPVKLQVPLIFSLRIMVKVKHLCLWDNGSAKSAKRSSKSIPAGMRKCPDASFFEVPHDYEVRSFSDWLAKEQLKARNRHTTSVEGTACTTPSTSSAALDMDASARQSASPATTNGTNDMP